MHYLDFDLIKQPDASEEAVHIGSSDLLVIYLDGEGRKAFLDSILKAAGFDAINEQVSTIRPKAANQDLDLSILLSRLGADAALSDAKIKRIMVFGVPPKKLGLHFQISNYAPVVVNGKTYLLADDLETIKAEKEAGNTQKAGALWRAVKAAFSNS